MRIGIDKPKTEYVSVSWVAASQEVWLDVRTQFERSDDGKVLWMDSIGREAGLIELSIVIDVIPHAYCSNALPIPHIPFDNIFINQRGYTNPRYGHDLYSHFQFYPNQFWYNLIAIFLPTYR